MTIQLARDILGRLGGGRFVHAGATDEVLVQELRLNGCEAWSAHEAPSSGPGEVLHALIVDLPAHEPAAFVAAIAGARPARNLVLLGAGRPRKAVDDALFAGPWRRHPAGLTTYEYGTLTDGATAPVSYFEREPDAATGMLRQSGGRADGQIARYALAAQYVRAGDRVLVREAGDGAAILAALSRGGEFIEGSADDLADRSVDLVVAMALEQAPDPEGALAAYSRVLKPDGRIVVSAAGAVGWTALANSLGQHFILEAKHLQAESARILRRADLDDGDTAEILLAVAHANPFECDEQLAAAYVHPALGGRGEGPTVADFGSSYDNPYLYRSLIQMGERLTDDPKLIRLALMVAQNARPDSPDRGGAIAVIGYRVLEARNLEAATEVMDLIEDYLAAAAQAQDPHAQRWRLSLEFLAGRLMEMTGNRGAAVDWYAAAARRDWRAFSPLLATKTVAASFYEGRLRLFDGDEAAARACFERGLREALAAAASPPEQVVGDIARPLPFGMMELAEVVDMGAQCSNALANLHLWARSPGLFWTSIDTRRFGLASWAKALEQENDRLRALAA